MARLLSPCAVAAAAVAWLMVAAALAFAEDLPCPHNPGWTAISPPEGPEILPDRAIPGPRAIAADPLAVGRLYVGGLGGLYRSRDCGETWEPISVPHLYPRPVKNSVSAVALDRGGVIYATADSEITRVSRDGGATWKVAATFRQATRIWQDIKSAHIASSPSVAGLTYAETHQRDLRGAVGIARTTDGGATWEMRAGYPLSYAVLAADALDPAVVYAASFYYGAANLRRSADGAMTFEPLGAFEDRVSALSMSADGSRFWAAVANGGLYRSADRGQTWEQVPDTPYRGYLVSISASPHDPRVLFAVTNEGELWAYWEPGPMDFPLPGGRFFQEANGRRGAGGTGFAVSDGDGIPFYTTFQSLPLASIGYPISHRFTFMGFTTQLFQKLALQWQPGEGVFFVNLFDDLHNRGFDPSLHLERSTPLQIDPSFDAGKPWDQIVQTRQALLDANPALKARYFAAPNPLLQYGLPTSRVEDFGPLFAIRTQRTVLQQWKVEVPWAKAGEVTVANGGEIAREAGIFPAEALTPQPPPLP